MKNQSIVILSSDDWGWKTSKYQLSTRFSQHNRVLFVSSIGFRTPRASRSDLGRIWRKLTAFLRGPRKVGENIRVLTPIVLPFGRGAAVDRLNRHLFALQYRLALRFLGLRKPYLFVFSPNWRPYLNGLERTRLIYYCVDEQSGFKGVDAIRFLEWDEELSKSAEHVVCSAEALYLKKRKLNANTHYVPHGVNWNHFSRALGDELPPVRELERLKAPILLFFGHVSYDWVDCRLLRFIAEQRPGWQIALAGRMAVDTGEFDGHTNIHVLGERNYDELPSLCRYASIGIIPFVTSELTAACNPLKLYEYLAAGLPVVSTDIPEVRRYSKVAHIAGSAAGFLKACDAALQLDRHVYSPKASALVREHDWERRVQQIYALLSATP